MPVISIPQLTPDNRLWRIDWFGEVDYQPGRHSQPCVSVLTSPVLCDPRDNDAILSTIATDHRHQRETWLPVGVMYLIKIGDLWQNGQCAHTPNYRAETFNKLEINKGTTDFIKAGLSISGEFLLPLNEHPWHRRQTQSYCTSVMLSNGKRIIIPCIELIRFYFGSSSRLLHLLFTELLTETLFWKHKHFDSFSGRLHLKLAGGLSGMSAADIGRMALDPNAWHAARMIFHTGMSASVQREPVYCYTGFPFIGETDLVVTGKWLSHGATADATFVVYSLKSCSHPFPFKALSYEVSDNLKVGAKKVHASTSLGQGHVQKPAFVKSAVAKSQKLADADPGKVLSARAYWISGNPRFPDLVNKAVWRERYDTKDPPAIVLLKSVGQDEQFSVGEGSSRNGRIRDIDLREGLARVPLSDVDQKQYKFVYDGIKLFATQDGLEDKIVTAELIILPGYTHPVISLPHLIDENGEIDPISFCIDGHRTHRLRRGCFAEFTINEKDCFKAFLVETEGDQGWSIAVMAVDDFDLMRAMRVLIKCSSSDLI